MACIKVKIPATKNPKAFRTTRNWDEQQKDTELCNVFVWRRYQTIEQKVSENHLSFGATTTTHMHAKHLSALTTGSKSNRLRHKSQREKRHPTTICPAYPNSLVSVDRRYSQYRYCTNNSGCSSTGITCCAIQTIICIVSIGFHIHTYI